MSIKKILKNTPLNLRLTKDQVDFIKSVAKKRELSSVSVIEALIHHLETLPEEDQSKLIKKYLTKNL